MQPTQRVTEVDERPDENPRNRKRRGRLAAALGSRLQGRGACGWPAHQVLADVLGWLRQEEAERMEEPRGKGGGASGEERRAGAHLPEAPCRHGSSGETGPLCLKDRESR